MHSTYRSEEIKKHIISSFIQYRVKHKLSQQELAEKLDVSVRTVSRIETGACFPRPALLKLLGIHYQINASNDMLPEARPLMPVEPLNDRVAHKVRQAMVQTAVSATAEELDLDAARAKALVLRVLTALAEHGVTPAEAAQHLR